MIYPRIATTPELKKLVEVAKSRWYNQLPDESVVQELDPNGNHILSFDLIHKHARGVPVPPHFRCTVHAKLIGRKKPEMFLLDCDIELFDALPDRVQWEWEMSRR